MVRIPFVDFITDDRFAINLPVEKRSDSTGEYLSNSFGVSEKVGPDCSDLRIVGTDTNPVHTLALGESRTYQYNTNTFQTTRGSVVILKVRLQNFNLSIPKSVQQKLAPPCAYAGSDPTYAWSDCSIERLDSDLVDDFDWGPHTEQPSDFIDEIDQWIDYVYVEKLPKGPAPNAPTNVNASDGTYADRVQITWDDVTNEDNYKVFRCMSSETGTCELIAKLQADSTDFDDMGAASDGTIYEYRLKSCNVVGGCSNYSTSDTGYRIAN